MPEPKTHGLLNNCPVNVCLPEIMEGVAYFADEKAIPKPSYEAHRPAYERLKKTFQDFYNLGEISWGQFHRIITEQVANNNTAAQVIMGPVLREYMGSPLQADGNYQQLTMNEASTGVLAPLGISVQEITLGADHSTRIKIPATNPVSDVKVFNSERRQHWDRAPDATEQKDDKEGMSRKLQTIYTSLLAFDVPAEGRKARVEEGLKSLKQEVAVLAENTAILARDVKPAKSAVKIFDQLGYIEELREKLKDSKSPHPQIATKDVANVKEAAVGEASEDFAKRLQDAELRKYDEEVKKSGPRR